MLCCAELLSSVRFFAMSWTVAFWAPLSIGKALEWVAMPPSRGSAQPRDWTRSPAFCRWILYQLSYQGSPTGNNTRYHRSKPEWESSRVLQRHSLGIPESIWDVYKGILPEPEKLIENYKSNNGHFALCSIWLNTSSTTAGGKKKPLCVLW